MLLCWCHYSAGHCAFNCFTAFGEVGGEQCFTAFSAQCPTAFSVSAHNDGRHARLLQSHTQSLQPRPSLTDSVHGWSHPSLFSRPRGWRGQPSLGKGDLQGLNMRQASSVYANVTTRTVDVQDSKTVCRHSFLHYLTALISKSVSLIR
jgi:hypothetical protein